MPFHNSLGSQLRNSGGKEHVPQPKRAYSRFFEGYTEYEVLGKNNKLKIDRVYTEDYYVQELSTKRRVAVKLTYVFAFFLLCAALVCLSVFSIMKPFWLMELLEAVAVFCLGWLLVALVYYVPAKKYMSIYVYKNATQHLIRSSTGLLGSSALLFAGAAVYMVVNGRFYALNLAVYFFCAAISFLIIFTEKSICYTSVSNSAVRKSKQQEFQKRRGS